MTITIIVDIGNYGTRIMYMWNNELIIDSFSSITASYRPLADQKEMVDIKFEEGHYYIGEDVRKFYKDKDISYMGRKKKGHADGAVRLIYALYRIYKKTEVKKFNIMLLSPYESINKDKDFFTEHFESNNTFFVNGKNFDFEVKNIGVTAEGLGAYYYSKNEDGNCILLDAGSGTMNIITLVNGTASLDETHTLNGGTNSFTPFELADKFQRKMKDIEDDEEIVVTGGKAEELARCLKLMNYENVTLPNLEDKNYYFANIKGTFELMYEDLVKDWND